MDNSDISILDRRFLEADVPLYVRPFCVVQEILSQKGGGDLLDEAIWEPVMECFHMLYPAGEFSFPPMLVGGVSFRDQFYLSRVNVGFGCCSVNPLECIDISKDELEVVWRSQPEHVWRAMYSVADLWDFAYGASDLRNQNVKADVLWKNARSSIEAGARLLAHGNMLEAAVQSICLSAELGIKGALTFLGVDDNSLKFDLKHNILLLVHKLSEMRPFPSDKMVEEAAKAFPDYVGTRYSDHGLTRVQINELALRAQFLAADALRRLSERNFSAQIQKDSRCPARTFP